MFDWGAGPALGLLTFLGYFVFVIGAVYLWRYREELAHWMQTEFSVLRRSLSRYVPSGPFYEPRGRSRLRVVPSTVFQSVTKLPQRRFSWAAALLFLGILLFFLDFFV
ncbi:MAG TPA: hypothetical protein VGF61_19635 [Candidatus Acidoferrum sp.]|jgi:hypothetical protein